MSRTSSSSSHHSKLALIIGIDQYTENDYLIPLPSCKKDATDLAELLRKIGYAIFSDGPVIIGSDLNREFRWTTIHRTIRDFFNSAEPDQLLLFYFSGHGILRGDEIYLATPQVYSRDPIVEGFSLSDLAKLMRSSKSRRIVSIIDACHSGAARLPDSGMGSESAAREEVGRALATYDRMLDNGPKGEGRYFLLSSQAYQLSFALPDDNSLYTKFLLEGLSGHRVKKDENGRELPGSVNNDGTITPESLHECMYISMLQAKDGSDSKDQNG
jgi:Caspase domain